jgi:hypothetical protein
VTSSPAGIDCGSTCAFDFAYNTNVTLTANTVSPSIFAGWSGGCSGNSLTCIVTLTQAQTVTATFNPPPPQTLTVIKSGNGDGTITSSPAGINCGSTCSASFDFNTTVTLTASPASSSTFGGWSGGGCSGTAATCIVTMDQAQTVTAAFNLANPTLIVAKGGNGFGTVTSLPSGIDCPTDCPGAVTAFPFNTTVTLTATQHSSSQFDGWEGGGCSGNAPTCTVLMNQAQTVTAIFTFCCVGIAPQDNIHAYRDNTTEFLATMLSRHRRSRLRDQAPGQAVYQVPPISLERKAAIKTVGSQLHIRLTNIAPGS